MIKEGIFHASRHHKCAPTARNYVLAMVLVATSTAAAATLFASASATASRHTSRLATAAAPLTSTCHRVLRGHAAGSRQLGRFCDLITAVCCSASSERSDRRRRAGVPRERWVPTALPELSFCMSPREPATALGLRPAFNSSMRARAEQSQAECCRCQMLPQIEPLNTWLKLCAGESEREREREREREQGRIEIESNSMDRLTFSERFSKCLRHMARELTDGRTCPVVERKTFSQGCAKESERMAQIDENSAYVKRGIAVRSDKRAPSLRMQAYNERYTGVPFGRCEYLDVFFEGTAARERSENAT